MLECWMGCPLQAKFRYVDRLPTRTGSRQIFGICIHAALEYYHQWGRLDTAKKIFLDYWDDPTKLGRGIDVWNRYTSHTGLREKGLEILTDYDHRARLDKFDFIAAEHPFLVPMGDHQLQGYVDLLTVKKSGRGKPTVVITDFKTKSKAPWKDALRLNVQMTIYHYASTQKEFWTGFPGETRFPGLPDGEELFDLYKDAGRRCIWWHLMGDKELDAGPRGVEDYEQVYRVCDQMEKALTAEVFVPRIGEETCGFCDYQEPCGLPIPLPTEPEEDQEWMVPVHIR